MNLAQVIRAIENAAAQQPPVRSIVRNDIYRLNHRPDAEYGVFAWLQGEHTTSAESSLTEWNFTLFYVDRLTADKGNEIQIQSTGIEVLENILRKLYDLGVFSGEYSFQVFNERFTDECAGVFCRVALSAPKNGLCVEDFGIAQTINII